MWNPNPPYIYFAGDSLACVRDTLALALKHGLIWRSLHANLYRLPQPGDHLLLVFWKTDEQRFVPLARFQTRAFDGSREQAVAGWGICYCVIPAQVQQHFLNAVAGPGGYGYTTADNPDFTAICVEKLEATDAVDLIWHGVAAGPHELPPVQYRYGWANPTQPALQHFNARLLNAPILPPSMYP